MTTINDTRGDAREPAGHAEVAASSASKSALTREELVSTAVTQWREEVSGLGGRNPLLTFRDLKAGTIDLAAAEPEARKALLDGEAVTVAKLFPHEPLRSSALRSAKALRNKSRELWQERGIQACMLAVGVATWANPYVAHRPSAPVMLRRASIAARDPAETDFTIELAPEPIVNPMLLTAMESQLGLRFTEDDLRGSSARLHYPNVVERLHEVAPAHVVDGFSVSHRAVLGTFATEPFEMGHDLDDLGADLEAHDVVAALAGDDQARATLSSSPPASEPKFVTFDLDNDQLAAVAAASAGGNADIDAPPGSGRTQTIAAIVAELIGSGERVLVCSQKRAGLNDLARRLADAGLSDAVIDLGTAEPADTVDKITRNAKALLWADRSQRPVGKNSGAKAARLARYLDAYRDAIHRPRGQQGATAYDALATVVSAPDDLQTPVRVSPADLEQAPELAVIREWFLEYADLGGLTLTPKKSGKGSPWHGAQVATEMDAAELLSAVKHLHQTAAPALRDAAVRASVEVGLAGPTTLTECLEAVDLLAAIGETIEEFGDNIWEEPLDELIYATGSRAYRAKHAGSASFSARRRLRGHAAELTGAIGRGARARTHKRLIAAREQLAGWNERSRGARRPRTGQHLLGAIDAAAVVRARLNLLTSTHPGAADIARLTFAEAGKRLNALLDDEQRLVGMPRLQELDDNMRSAGFGTLLDDVAGSTPSLERLDALVTYIWHASMLERWRIDDPVLREFNSLDHDELFAEFGAEDAAALDATAADAVAAWTRRFEDVASRFEGQAAVIGEMKPGSGPQTPKALLATAPDVALAAAPCWLASPFVVPRALPPRRLFDVMIIDGAGQLPVAQAISALARAKRVVLVSDDDVALDELTVVPDPKRDDDDHEGPWSEAPPYCTTDALRGSLPRFVLSGQHRARDDRLTGFVTRNIYSGRSVTIPAAWGQERAQLVTVEVPGGDDGPVDSSTTEINRVVELIIEHLRTRPHESLGVVTLVPRHAERLDDALRRALVRAPDVAPLLDENRDEPFFIKPAGQIGGDTRDAVIVSLGYGRSVDGRILYRFGALGRPGGERQLAAVASRARERMTVVSTFGHDDLSPRRLVTPGAQALGALLSYLGSSREAVEPGPFDPLAETVAEKLRDVGADAEVGYGGEAGVAVAVRHPNRKGRFVLAVETDGPAYAARGSARVRERQRTASLRELGWTVHRVWSAAWLSDPGRETRRLISAYEQAAADADAYDWAVAAAEADIVAGMPDDDELPDADSRELAAGGNDSEQSVEDTESGGIGAQPRKSGRVGRRPVPGNRRAARSYGARTLAAMARWVESDNAARKESVAALTLAVELGFDVADISELEPRTRDSLVRAVRVARAGAPSRL